MVHDSEYTRLAREMQAQPNEEITIQSVLSHALEVVEDAEMASLTVRARRQSYKTLGATSPIAESIDQAQYSLSEGPCVSSAEGAEWFRSGNIAKDDRWPRWAPIAAAKGARSFLSLRLQSKGKPFGALNLYSSKLHGFADRDDVDVALVYGVHAANALSTARLVDNLEAALGTRHGIGIAQGVLMERYGMSVDQSFAFLQRLSQSRNQKLRDVARQIVCTREVPELGVPTIQ